MTPCPRCRRSTCQLRAVTDFARSKGWPYDLGRFVAAVQDECDLVTRELRTVVREAWAV